MPKPQWFRGRWAALAAVCAARSWNDVCFADDTRWRYDDSGGNWAEIHYAAAGRAILIGHDHELSQTYYAESAEYFGEPETDLLAGAPGWWSPVVEVVRARGDWIGFVYGFDNGWQRAAYDLEDGRFLMGIPGMRGDSAVRKHIAEFAKDAPGLKDEPSKEAIYTLIQSDANITEEQLTAVIGTSEWDVAAGVTAARKFLAAG